MKTISQFLLVSLLIGLVGCGDSSSPSAESETKKGGGPVAENQLPPGIPPDLLTRGKQAKKKPEGTIGVSVLTMTNPFFKLIADTMADEAAKNGFEVIATSGEFDPNKQKDQVKDFIVKKVQAIALSPCDSKSVGPAIEEANKAGIPVFTFDIKSLAPEGKVVSHIATDNFQGGQMAGNAMIEALGEEGGKIIILDFKQAESCLLRVQGFKEVIDKHNAENEGKIEIVAELPGEGQKDRGFRATEDALQSNPDMKGIFAINDPSGLGARAALEKAGKQDQVKIVAFDGQPEGKQAIKDGKIFADPVQFPTRIARQTVQSIMKYFDGEKLPAEQLIPTELYRQSDGLKDPDLN